MLNRWRCTAIKTDHLKSILGTRMTEGEHHLTQVVLCLTYTTYTYTRGGGGTSIPQTNSFRKSLFLLDFWKTLSLGPEFTVYNLSVLALAPVLWASLFRRRSCLNSSPSTKYVFSSGYLRLRLCHSVTTWSWCISLYEIWFPF